MNLFGNLKQAQFTSYLSRFPISCTQNRVFLNMPIVVKDFDWTQTVDSVCITLPLKGVHASKADVYCACCLPCGFEIGSFPLSANDVYIKVNFPPYFFQLDLLHPVDSETSTCTVGNGTVVFQLVKVSHIYLQLEYRRAHLSQTKGNRLTRA